MQEYIFIGRKNDYKYYELKTLSGETVCYDAKQIRDMLSKNLVIHGLKLSKDGKILVEKGNYQSISMKQVINKNQYNENWIIGSDLIPITEPKSRLRHRFCYNLLQKYIESENTYYICALYGLRRTGKTVLMYQMIYELLTIKNIDKIAYISFSRNTLYTDETLIKDIEKLVQYGIKYIFVDEISFVKMHMEENCLNLLADKYASKGIKIVITGTFSYAIKLLEEESLFDRLERIDTTYFSYKEAHDILNYDIEEFIEYGGIIKDHNPLRYTTEEYINTAISKNIASALIKSEKIYDVFPNYSENNKNYIQNKIETLTKHLIDQYMKQIVYNKVVKYNFKYTDIGRLVLNVNEKLLYDSIVSELGDYIALDKNKYYSILNDKWLELTQSDIDEKSFTEFLNIFKKINVIIDVFFENQINSVFSSHYLRYNLCTKIVDIIYDTMKTETKGRYSASLANDIVRGDILESIVQLDIYKTDQYVFDKYRNSDGWEIDLIIKHDDYIDLYEIKHSDKIVPEQTKNLINNDFIKEIEEKYNRKIGKKVVLYRGLPSTELIDPISVFDSIIKDKRMLGKPTDRWESIKNRAINQNWQLQTIEYENIESFLCSL